MKLFLKFYFLFSLFTLFLHAEREKVDISMVISGGVSLGAYEAGYNWALIKMLSAVKTSNKVLDPEIASVAGASAGSINALLTAMYWCQKESVPLKNHVDDNLFYETWVNLGIQDLLIKGKDSENKSSLFTQKGLEKKGDKIIEHLKQPIFKKNCAIPLGIAVTKVRPIVEQIGGINVKNQNFSVPLTFREKDGKAIVENRVMPPSKDFYISIPGIEKDRKKVIHLLLASGAFPGAFQQVKLDYSYKGKNYSHYFVDGGLYDNVPLDLSIELNKDGRYFFFMDPSNIRKETVEEVEEDENETLPVGFITPTLLPVFDSFGIMQSMKLYNAINQNFRGDTDKKLVLSSRYHPITGEFLEHFGAFLDHNFRVYDYYVGVYDAIYRMAIAFKRNFPEKYANMSHVDIMNYAKTLLNLDKNPEALAAYTLFLNTEFYGLKPKTTDRFSAIYNAFNLKKSDENRYDIEEFKAFLTKLDMRYMGETGSSFLTYAKEDVDNWYRRSLRNVIDRITILEEDREKAGLPGAYATEAKLVGWASTPYTQEKKGFHFLPLSVSKDKEKEGLRNVLRLLPEEIAADVKNGGMSFGYTAIYYPRDKKIISGFEGKVSYVAIHDEDDFVRADINLYKEYNDIVKFGVGASFFGNTVGSFYQRDNAFGFNTYVDIMNLFRVTYVRRDGDLNTNDYIYFGIENIPSLIYWMNR
jgi:predicted acylesterase/phospholipase RssA